VQTPSLNSSTKILCAFFLSPMCLHVSPPLSGYSDNLSPGRHEMSDVHY
jgi:hypothetical protein